MTAHPQNVFLIGPMGSGKTTIGRQLAKLLGLEFHDCDLELERQTGASVNLIFDIEGETGFREREHRMLEELTGRRGVLVATGGGVVCFEENRRLLRSRGFVVYLKTGVGQQLKRLAQDKSRPLLQGQDRSKRLRELAATRNPLYEATADLVFHSRRTSVHASTRALATVIRERLDAPQTGAVDANG